MLNLENVFRHAEFIKIYRNKFFLLCQHIHMTNSKKTELKKMMLELTKRKTHITPIQRLVSNSFDLI